MSFKQQKIDILFRRARGVNAATSRDPPDVPDIAVTATERPEMNDGGGPSDTVRRSGRQRAPAVSYFESDASSSDEEWVDSAEEVESPSDHGKKSKK